MEDCVLGVKQRVAAQKEMGSLGQRLGERIAQVRRQRGMTQTEVAQLMGVTQTVVSEYEKGTVRLHVERIVQLSKLLNVSADELLGLRPTKRDGEIGNRRFLRRLKRVDCLSRREQDALLKTMDAFLKAAER